MYKGGICITNVKFSLGQIVMTTGVKNLFDTLEVIVLLSRHSKGDWGDLPKIDKKLNESALLLGNDRLFSAYLTPKGKVYIITEHDRSITTVLLPDEY